MLSLNIIQDEQPFVISRRALAREGDYKMHHVGACMHASYRFFVN